MKPELLLPVGNKAMCLAAIHNGADAVYMGVPEFNARGRSKDFSQDELRELIELCHLYGVKVHLAFNVLIFEDELLTVKKLEQELLALAPDALIIQDIGLATLVRRISGDIPIHASTQMTVTNYESIELLQDLGIQRYVLGREVSISEMELIRKETAAELEVFVHGALCVAYSGQCFTSEGIGGRSANRGQCAQSCRLDYDMFVDGEKKDLGEKRFLVSPQDLCGLEDVPKLAQIGITSFKVEGRLKSPEYVAQVAEAYSKARMSSLLYEEQVKLKQKMGLTYSRGFFSGWLHGVDHQKLVDGTYSAHRGIFIGEVIGHQKGILLIKSSLELRAGQGLLLVWNQNDRKVEVGGKISSVILQKEKIRKQKSKSNSDNIYHVSLWQNTEGKEKKEIPVDTKVYMNSDPQMDKELQQSYHSRENLKKIPLHMLVTGSLDNHLSLQVSDGHHTVQVNSGEPLVSAENFPLTIESLKEILGQLGGTCFYLDSFASQLGDKLFLHQREIKEMRQKASKEMEDLRMRPRTYSLNTIQLMDYHLNPIQTPLARKNSPRLHLLLREKGQVRSLLNLMMSDPEIGQTLGDIILDYEFGKDYAPSLEALREIGLSVGIATTRILKPKEHHHLKVIERISPDVILIRNLGALQFFKSQEKEIRLIGDFSLNATNHLTCDYLLSKGLATICASYDLSATQLKNLIQSYAFGPERIEVTLHQYMPLFHMEHCVFAAFLSKGSSFRDCGKPCEKHRVELRDAYGNSHFLKADQECRNTMFSGKAQSAAMLVQDLQELGVRHFRLELLDETEEIFRQKVLGYFRLLSRGDKGADLLHSLGAIERYGVDTGTLGMERHIRDRKKS